jgi:hypothetical protein
MPPSTEAFQQAGLRIALEEFERLVMEAVRRTIPPRPIPDGRAGLTSGEVAVLEQTGVGSRDLAPPGLGARSPLVLTAADYAAVLATALPVPELARRLGVDQRWVRRRVARHALIAVRDGAAWRLPLFQLDDLGQQLVPGLEMVAPRLAHVHPVAAARWFTLPHADLVGDEGRPISPRAWLLGGGEPEAVAALADELHERG